MGFASVDIRAFPNDTDFDSDTDTEARKEAAKECRESPGVRSLIVLRFACRPPGGGKIFSGTGLLQALRRNELKDSFRTG